jgi:hypothetical protein
MGGGCKGIVQNDFNCSLLSNHAATITTTTTGFETVVAVGPLQGPVKMPWCAYLHVETITNVSTFLACSYPIKSGNCAW